MCCTGSSWHRLIDSCWGGGGAGWGHGVGQHDTVMLPSTWVWRYVNDTVPVAVNMGLALRGSCLDPRCSRERFTSYCERQQRGDHTQRTDFSFSIANLFWNINDFCINDNWNIVLACTPRRQPAETKQQILQVAEPDHWKVNHSDLPRWQQSLRTIFPVARLWCWNYFSLRQAIHSKAWTDIKSLLEIFDKSRKLASASWSLLALASSGAAPRHHVNIH